MTELLPIKTHLEQCGLKAHYVNARDLYAFLGVKREFAKWFKERVEKYDFKKGVDFQELVNVCSPKLASKKQPKQGGHNRTDYLLTLTMAKELSMLESNEQGKFARQYFIKCEEQLAEIDPDVVNTYRQAWRAEREASKTPYLKMCEALARSRQQQGKPCPQHLFTNEANMLASLVVGMSIQQWKQAHGIKSEVREAFNAEQLAKLTYLEQADEMLLDMGMADFQQRKAKLAEMLKNRFKD